MPHAIIDRSPRGHRQLAWLGALTLLAGCGHEPTGSQVSSHGGTRPSPLPETAALISAPTAHLVPGSAGYRIALAYVSMSPGTEPGGDSVTIIHLRGGQSVGTRMTDGGFDPLAIEAEAGDTLAIAVFQETGPTSTTYGVVPIKMRPRVVRTSPAATKTDVPLNTVILVVFNEPMDSMSLSDALHLQLKGRDVPGTVTGISVGGVILSGKFVPTSPLESASSYQFSVSTAARDLSGIPLAATLQVPFTTADTGSQPTPPDPPITTIVILDPPSTIGVGETALLHAWADGDRIGRIRPRGPIVWSNTDESIATIVPTENNGYPGVDFTANLQGITPGVVTITAAADGITASVMIKVGEPAASIMVSPTTATISASGCEAVQLTAVLRDAAGGQLFGRRPVWSSSNSSAYAEPITGLVFAGDSGTTTVTANTGLVAASSAITVVGHIPRVPGGHLPLCD